ncbi:MAG: hypothetical protein BWY88_01075 [Synergistetes bacterium ADurb.Bin520]|nr:MAG: hypothetical protein BWY88_01075 [Synergistetes bacterium ADurb.Bin520]
MDPSGVPDVRRKRQGQGEPLLHHDLAGQRGAGGPVEPDIGQKPPVAVPLLNVRLEAYPLSQDQGTVGDRRLQAELLHLAGRVVQFGRIDQEVADFFDAPVVQGDFHRVAVEHGDHEAFQLPRGGGGAQREPKARKQGQCELRELSREKPFSPGVRP